MSKTPATIQIESWAARLARDNPFALLEQLQEHDRLVLQLKDFETSTVVATPGGDGIPAIVMAQRRLWLGTDQVALVRRILGHYYGQHPTATIWPESNCPYAADDEEFVRLCEAAAITIIGDRYEVSS